MLSFSLSTFQLSTANAEFRAIYVSPVHHRCSVFLFAIYFPMSIANVVFYNPLYTFSSQMCFLGQFTFRLSITPADLFAIYFRIPVAFFTYSLLFTCSRKNVDLFTLYFSPVHHKSCFFHNLLLTCSRQCWTCCYLLLGRGSQFVNVLQSTSQLATADVG